MKNIFAAMFIGLLLVVLVFRGIGGSFDTKFWLSFLPGLMENLVALAGAVFIIDRIRGSQRIAKLERTNAGQSRYVLFLSNRLAFLLLKHLALATDDEFGKDSELNFEFARGRFKDTNLADVFYGKLMESNNKEEFTTDFEEILSSGTETILKAFDGLYPRPDPAIKQNVEEMNFSIGSVGGLKMLIASFKAANEQIGAHEQMTPEQLDLLIKIAYIQIRPELQKLQDAILQLSEKATSNELFLSLD